MPFDWKEYLLLAQKIYRGREELGHEEAIHRCAVSRAYYSAFCGSRNFARDHLQYEPSNSSQDQITIRDHFRHRGREDVASKLYDLTKWRRQCDYDDVVFNIDTLSNSAIRRAFEIFGHLDRMLGSKTRSKK
jgi:hypothetical protein